MQQEGGGALENDPVFSPVGLLPHHDDHPFWRHMSREAHVERHRNTEDYVAASHSPKTNRCVVGHNAALLLCIMYDCHRKNAGILLRRMSDDFNVRKFPDELEQVKTRQRSQSEGSVGTLPDGEKTEKEEAADRPTRVFKFIRRLSSTAISPMTPTPTGNPKSFPPAKPFPRGLPLKPVAPLPEHPTEED